MGSRRVVVIGAGLAGLTVATDLESAGWDVAVVEARSRVGGRVFSHRFGGSGGPESDPGSDADGARPWCERGAEFVNSSDTEVLALCERFGLRLLERPEPGIDALLDVGGRPAPAAAQTAVVDAEAVYDVALDDLADRYRAALAADDAATLAALDSANLADLMAPVATDLAARVWLGRSIRTEWMLPPDQLSLLFVAEQAVHGPRGSERERFRVHGGNDRIAAALAARLSRPVRLSTAVQRVHTDGRVELVGGEVLMADAVVCTVPLPVLGRIWPDAPTDLVNVSYGIGGKVSLELARRVWLDYGRSGHVLSDRAWGEMWDTTDVQPGDAGVLTTLLSSHDGAAFMTLPDRVNRIISEADRVHPGARGLVRAVVDTDWTNDPYSLGAYVAFGPGQVRRARRAMAQPFDRLWLAGEHTDERSGFMEGAVRSGRRVAAALGA